MWRASLRKSRVILLKYVSVESEFAGTTSGNADCHGLPEVPAVR